jgi:hypothetical protein
MAETLMEETSESGDYSKLSKFCNRVRTALQWRLDVAKGEMIEQRLAGHDTYTKDYLGFAGTVSQRDLENICSIVNDTFRLGGSSLRVRNSMGEIHPAGMFWKGESL